MRFLLTLPVLYHEYSFHFISSFFFFGCCFQWVRWCGYYIRSNFFLSCVCAFNFIIEFYISSSLFIPLIIRIISLNFLSFFFFFVSSFWLLLNFYIILVVLINLSDWMKLFNSIIIFRSSIFNFWIKNLPRNFRNFYFLHVSTNWIEREKLFCFFFLVFEEFLSFFLYQYSQFNTFIHLLTHI